MHIAVCVKQVPDTTEIKIDHETNRLIREGVPSIVNPFDAYALELAVRLKETAGGTVTVLSMGPDQAKTALRKCLSVGADQAYLISDRQFGGSDTLATSYILSHAIHYLEAKEKKFDLIFCGKMAIDGDTAQVGPELAEHLDRSQITCVIDTPELMGERVKVKQETETGYRVLEALLPSVLTVSKLSFEPRYPNIKSNMMANRAEIPVITLAELSGIDSAQIGLKGSPTKVKKTFTPQLKASGLMIDKASPQESAKELAALLKQTYIR